MPDYPKEQLWELYKDLPKNLQNALFSSEIGDNIYEICERNEVEGKKTSEISKNIGYVFLGLLPPSNFQQVLKKEIGLIPKTAENVSVEIERFVFLPLRKNLEAIYKETIKVRKPKKEITPLKKKITPLKKKDEYREPTE